MPVRKTASEPLPFTELVDISAASIAANG
jgi:hypothetical protein